MSPAPAQDRLAHSGGPLTVKHNQRTLRHNIAKALPMPCNGFPPGPNYRARNPKKSPLWQCAHRHCDEFEAAYPSFDDPRVVEQILRYLGAWHDPPTAEPPAGFPGPSTHEPWPDDPMPDYENVLTD